MVEDPQLVESKTWVKAAGRVSCVYLTVSDPSLTTITYSVPGELLDTLAKGKEKVWPVHP